MLLVNSAQYCKRPRPFARGTQHGAAQDFESPIVPPRSSDSGGKTKPRPPHSLHFRPYIWPLPRQREHVSTWHFSGGKFFEIR